MIEPEGMLPMNTSTLFPLWSVSLTLSTLALCCVAVFHIMCPFNGSPVVIVVLA